MQRAGGRLAEVRGEENQGDRNERDENRPSPPNLLVMHVVVVSKIVPDDLSVPVPTYLVPTAPVA